MKKETIERIRNFSTERDWDQFHTPANLAKSISIEANELLECFQWSDADLANKSRDIRPSSASTGKSVKTCEPRSTER